MGNVLFNGIHIDAQLPVDLKYPVDSIAARNAILPEVAYEGMLVYVRDNNRLYILTNTAGLTDGTGWEEVGSGTGSGGASLAFAELTVNSDLTRSHLYEIGASSLTLTLPASPTVGDVIYFSNSRSLTGTIIARNGNNIMRLAEDLELDNPHASFCLFYTNATNGWVIIGGDGGGQFMGMGGAPRDFGDQAGEIARFAEGNSTAEIPRNRVDYDVLTNELSNTNSTIRYYAVNVIPAGTSNLTITYPDPEIGSWFEISNLSGDITNSISAAGRLFQGQSTNLILDDDTASFRLTYINDTTGFVITGAN